MQNGGPPTQVGYPPFTFPANLGQKKDSNYKTEKQR
jgi:hypothetical protein